MPVVPLIEQNVKTAALPTTTLGAGLRAPRLNLPEARNNTAVQNAQNNLAAAVSGAAVSLGQVASEAKVRADKVQLLDAQSKLDDWQVTKMNDAYSLKGKDAFDIPKRFGSEYDQFASEVEKSLGNDDQRFAFRQMAVSRRDGIMGQLYGHERQEMDGVAKQTADTSIDTSIDRAVNFSGNPEISETAIKNAKDTVKMYGDMQGWPEVAVNNKIMEVESKARLGILTRLADDNPTQAMKYYKDNLPKFTADNLLQAQRMMVPVERKGKATEISKQVLGNSQPIANQDQIISYVMHDLEGGDKTIADGNGIAKFGINSAANPGVDVANLDESGAKAIYKAKYWDAIDADKLPADMRLVAFDTAVNHGVGKAKELIAASGGDARKLLELREQEYNRLAKENPDKYGANLNGWINRLSNLNGQIDTMRGKMPSPFEMNQKIDSMTNDLEVAQEAKKMVKATLDSIEESKKQAYAQANEEAWKYRVSGREVPPSVQARMNPEDISKMLNSAAPDGALYEQVRGAVVTGQPVNLNDYRWQLGSKYDELVALQQDPSKQINARKVDDVIKSNASILIGKSTPQTETEIQKVEDFRRSVQNEIDAIQRSSGKPASADQVQQISDRLLLKVNDSYWDGLGAKRYYELKPGEKFEIDGVPSDRALFVNGAPTAYQEVISNITDYLESKKLPVTSKTIADTYTELVNKGRIVQKEQ